MASSVSFIIYFATNNKDHLYLYFQESANQPILSPQLSVLESLYDESKCTILYAALYVRQKTWVPKEILVSDWSISKKIFSSDTTWSN